MDEMENVKKEIELLATLNKKMALLEFEFDLHVGKIRKITEELAHLHSAKRSLFPSSTGGDNDSI